MTSVFWGAALQQSNDNGQLTAFLSKDNTTEVAVFSVDSDERIDEADSDLNDDCDPGLAAAAMGSI